MSALFSTQTWRLRGSKKALITADNAAWTYRDLHQAACRVAVYLGELGVRRGERILLVLDDTLMFPSAFLGANLGFEMSKAGYKTLNIDKLPAAGYGSTANSCAMSLLDLGRGRHGL